MTLNTLLHGNRNTHTYTSISISCMNTEAKNFIYTLTLVKHTKQTITHYFPRKLPMRYRSYKV